MASCPACTHARIHARIRPTSCTMAPLGLFSLSTLSILSAGLQLLHAGHAATGPCMHAWAQPHAQAPSCGHACAADEGAAMPCSSGGASQQCPEQKPFSCRRCLREKGAQHIYATAKQSAPMHGLAHAPCMHAWAGRAHLGVPRPPRYIMAALYAAMPWPAAAAML